jgi:HlyD family secretion protein
MSAQSTLLPQVMEQSPMSRRSIITLAAVIAIVVAALLAAWLRRPPLVAAVSVQAQPLLRTLQFSGRVATLSRVEIGSTLTGRVVEVGVAEGAQVKHGDVLVRLESDELRATLEQARAGEQQARARLAGLRSSGRSAVRAGQAQAASVLAAAQAELRRTDDLVAQGFVSQSRLDEARRAVEVAQAQLDNARAQSAANAERGTDVAQADAQLALARSASAAAAARLAQTTVTAPADARVLDRLVEPGQIVQPGRALLALALSGPLQLVAQVDERYLEQLQVGQEANVVADAYPTERFAARVLSIAPLVDAQRGAVEVKFALPQASPPFLREDMTLSIDVETARRERALALPVTALHDVENASGGAATATVFIERDGRVEARRVRLGIRTLDAVEVLDGLVAGERVMLGSALSPGSRVRADLAATPAAALSRGGARERTREDAGSAITNSMGR